MIDHVALGKLVAKQRGRRNRALGEHGQVVAAHALRRAGFVMVETVHTPWRIMRGPKGNIVSATPVEKVSGDLRAIAPGGFSVLCEVKARSGKLLWSDFAHHQTKALDAHHRAGGLSFVAWVTGPECHLMRWPIADFHAGTSITEDGLTERMAKWTP